MNKAWAAMLLAATMPVASGAAEGDTRRGLDVGLYAGWQLDNFRAADIRNAVNPQVSGDSEQDAALSFHFDYELWGAGESAMRRNLWLYGSTVRTVRSTDVLCRDNPRFVGCPEFDGTPSPGDLPGADEAFVILRDAESIEGHLGLRKEFGSVGRRGNRGRFYVGAEMGFASVENAADDLAAIHYASFGAVLTEGRYKRSFIEIGPGKNDLFIDETNRWRVRAHLEPELFGIRWLKFYLETEIEFDGSDGSDSIRTILGVRIPIDGMTQGNSSTDDH